MQSRPAPARAGWGRRLAQGWGDRISAWRDRTLASPRFQRLAADLPFTRPVARRRAAALFDLCAGFVYSQVLLACVRLGVFDALADGPRTGAWLSSRLHLDRAATDRLMAAAASLDLVSRRPAGRWGLGPLGAALRGNPGLSAMIEHHALVYRDLADPVALLRGETGETGLARYWRYSGGPTAMPDADTAASYSALMAGTQAFVQDDILDAYRFDRHTAVLDVGGGDGSFLAGVARRYPRLSLMLFDLPPVASLAAGRFAKEGLSGRAQAIGGDFRVDALPEGADIVTLVRVLHDHDDATVTALLASVRRALPPGGRVLVAEPMAGTPGLDRIGSAYFGFYLMAMGGGRPRTFDRLAEMLGDAGFTGVRAVRTRRPMLTSLMVADVSIQPDPSPSIVVDDTKTVKPT